MSELVAVSLDNGATWIHKGEPGFEEALIRSLSAVQNEPPVDDGSIT